MSKERSPREQKPTDVTGGPRPTIRLVVALLLVVSGIATTLLGLFGGIATLTANELFSETFRTSAGEASDIGDAVSGLTTIVRIQGMEMLVFAGLSVYAVAAGIGLLRQTSWSIRHTFIWSGAALVYLVMERMMQLLYLTPTAMAHLESMIGPENTDPAAQAVVATHVFDSSIAPAFLLAALPLSITVWMIRQRREVPISRTTPPTGQKDATPPHPSARS